MPYDSISSDELLDVKRQLESEIGKLEMRIETQLHAARFPKSHVTRKEMDEAWDDIHCLSALVVKLGKSVDRLFAAVEELALG